MDKHILHAENLTSGYDGKIVVDNVSIAIPDGKISVILGANATVSRLC
jgi:iron complex transport system ATP-binding protein